MFRFELKKIFGKKKVAILGVFLSFCLLYSVFVMVRPSNSVTGNILLEFIGGLDYFCLTVTGIIMVTAATLFPVEREAGMSQVLMSSKRGKKEMAKVKVAVALFVANVLFILSVLVLVLGYLAVFGRDFGIPLGEAESFGMEYTGDPGIQTYGDLLFMMMAGIFLSMNFTALFTMFLSVKFQRALPTAASVVLLYFAGTVLPEIPVLGFVFNLSPICLGMRAVTYRVLFSVGSLSVTVLHVGFGVYVMLIVALFWLLSNEKGVKKNF